MATAEHRERNNEPPRFDLVRWFSWVALIAGAAVTISAAYSLSAFLTDRMVEQEAALTADIVRGIVATEDAYYLFEAERPIDARKVPDLIRHMTTFPDVLRTNIYSSSGLMLWSSDPRLIGQRFSENEELREALTAEAVVHSGVIERSDLPKSEHGVLGGRFEQFIETYTPIFDRDHQRVIGVVEVYRVPDRLFDAIADGRMLIWTGAILTTIFLFVAFAGIVAKGQQVIEIQHERLVEREGLAVVGEMSSAVAHGLRNPLASIRSSAELVLSHDLPEDAREFAGDIVDQVDRLEGWIRRLLIYARPDHATVGAVAIGEVIADCAETYRKDLERRGVLLNVQVDEHLPRVRGEAGLLGQMVNSLIANAGEAIPESGRISIRATRRDGGVVVEVVDDGPGLPVDDLTKVFAPFYTTKQKGLGLGLPLVKRVIERLGGAVIIENTEPHGVSVKLYLPVHLREA